MITNVLYFFLQNAGLIQDFNISILNHLSFGLENVPLTGKMDSDDEKTLNAIEKAIIAAKTTLQTATGYCTDTSVPKVSFIYFLLSLTYEYNMQNKRKCCNCEKFQSE